MLFYPVLCKLAATDARHSGNCVDEFAQQRRRSKLFVFADVAPDVGQVEDFARADEGFEEEVAVVIAAGAVAFGGMFGNQVEYGGFGIAGKSPSFKPNRQMTLNGRLRIGTILQKVMPPRKSLPRFRCRGNVGYGG